MLIGVILLKLTRKEKHASPKSMDWSLYDNGLRHERVKWTEFA